MVAPLDPLKPHKCTYHDCFLSFDTEQETKDHKIREASHHYCKRCDVDCKDWEHLLQHKVDTMAYWLVGEGKNMKKKKMKHVVCEFCGEEFGSLSGRDHHRRQFHQADQEIRCPGFKIVVDPNTRTPVREECPHIFARPSGLIRHLEEGSCMYIPKKEFIAERQQKHVVKQIMQAPHLFAENLRINKAFATDNPSPGLIKDEELEGQANTGGVSLLDTDEPGQATAGGVSLQAETNIMDMSVPLSVKRETHETWPKLPSALNNTLNEGIASISIGSRSSSIGRTTPPDRSAVTSPTGTGLVYTEGYPSLGRTSARTSSSSSTLVNDVNNAASISSASAKATPKAWSTGATSSALFPNAQPTPSPVDWDAILAAKARNQREDDRTNLFRARFWDPTSDEYDAQRFLHSVIGKYMCPFPGCENALDTADEISGHLRYSHGNAQITCPSCKKLFQTTVALVQHIESGMRGSKKCHFARSEDMAKALDEVTGGFLDARYVEGQSRVHGYKTEGRDGNIKAVKVDDEFPHGIMDIKFQAKLPTTSTVRYA